MSGSTENRAHGASEKPVRRDKVLSLADACNMLPLVQRVVADVVASHRTLLQLTPEQERLHRQRRALDWPQRSRMYEISEQIAAADHSMQESLAELGSLGVVVVDAEFGRVGFPTVVNGRPAYFSWQPGEVSVAFWHFREEERRRPVPVTWVKSAKQSISDKS